MRKQNFGISVESDSMSKSEILNSVRNILRLCTETIAQPPDLNPFLIQKIDSKIRQPDFILKYFELKLDRFRVLPRVGEPNVEGLNKYWSQIFRYSKMWKNGEQPNNLKYHFYKAQILYTDPKIK